jgi:hypothetical protein
VHGSFIVSRCGPLVIVTLCTVVGVYKNVYSVLSSLFSPLQHAQEHYIAVVHTGDQGRYLFEAPLDLPPSVTDSPTPAGGSSIVSKERQGQSLYRAAVSEAARQVTKRHYKSLRARKRARKKRQAKAQARTLTHAQRPKVQPVISSHYDGLETESTLPRAQRPKMQPVLSSSDDSDLETESPLVDAQSPKMQPVMASDDDDLEAESPADASEPSEEETPDADLSLHMLERKQLQLEESAGAPIVEVLAPGDEMQEEGKYEMMGKMINAEQNVKMAETIEKIQEEDDQKSTHL